MLSEIRQSQRDRYCRIPLSEVSNRGVTFIDAESRKMITRGREERECGVSV